MSVTGAAPLRFTHASGLVAVVEQLDALHRESLKMTAGEAGRVRLSVANIIAACTDAGIADHAAHVLTAIGEDHPARSIVLIADPTREAMLDADIALRCLPGTDRVCTELVRLVVHGEPAYHLAGIVTPLLIPDIPVHLWLVGAPRMEQAFAAETVLLCERIVLDSGAYEDPVAALTRIAAAVVEHGRAISVGDLAWQRSREWRELCAQAFDPAEIRPWLGRITELEVCSAGPVASAQAWLVAGWLAARLSWPERGGPRVSVAGAIDPHAESGDLLKVRVHGEHDGANLEVVLQRSQTTLHTSMHGPAGSTFRSVVLRHWDEAELVGGLMADSTDSAIYAAAVQRAALLAAAG